MKANDEFKRLRRLAGNLYESVMCDDLNDEEDKDYFDWCLDDLTMEWRRITKEE